jgi:hypothetical protein
MVFNAGPTDKFIENKKIDSKLSLKDCESNQPKLSNNRGVEEGQQNFD